MLENCTGISRANKLIRWTLRNGLCKGNCATKEDRDEAVLVESVKYVEYVVSKLSIVEFIYIYLDKKNYLKTDFFDI